MFMGEFDLLRFMGRETLSVMVTERRPRVLVVEDDDWIRQSLETAIQWSSSGLELAASASRGGEAIRQAQAGCAFDVALVDLGLPDMHGTAVIRRLLELAPDSVPLVFTVFDDPATIMQAISSGAQGYLLKSSSIDAVLRGIAEVGQGGGTMTPSVARIVLDSMRKQQQASISDTEGIEALTPREKEVLGYLSRGLTYPQVAEQLSLKLSTIQGYVKQIYRKLQVDSKAEAAALAQRVGLL